MEVQPRPRRGTRARLGEVKLPFDGAIRAIHEGAGLSASLFKLCEQAEMEIRYEAQALRIVTEANGQLAGGRSLGRTA